MLPREPRVAEIIAAIEEMATPVVDIIQTRRDSAIPNQKQKCSMAGEGTAARTRSAYRQRWH